MKTGIMFALICLLSIPMVVICQNEPPPEWLFDDDEEIQGWGGMNQLAPLKLDEVKDEKGNVRTVLITESLGGDPYVFPDGGWQGFNNALQQPFDGKKYDTIYIGVRVNADSSWQIYYATEEDATYSERQVQNFQVAAIDEFQDYEFKMETGGWNQETVTGFRIDPGTIANVIAEIDYLSMRDVPEDVKPKAVDQAGKLAITWGKIKK